MNALGRTGGVKVTEPSIERTIFFALWFRRHLHLRPILLGSLFGLLTLTACSSTPQQPTLSAESAGRDPDRLLVVDCLLPGQLRRLGRNITFMTPRRPTKASASECEIRGGEYVAYDRANFATSLKIWLPKAETGDPEAQTFVGEIFEKGLGQIADPEVAAAWYRKAADQGYSRAQINLGYLYESGLGVTQDLTQAMNLYRQAAGFDDGSLEYVTTVELVAREQQAAELPVLREKVQEANAILEQERRDFAQLKTNFNKLEQETESVRRQLATTPARSAPKPDSSGSENAAVSILLTDINTLNNQLSDSEQERSSLREQLEQQQLETGKLRQQVSAASSEIFVAQDDLAAQTARISDLERQLIVERDANVSETDNKIVTLQAQLSETLQNRDAVLSQIDTLKSQESSRASELRAQLEVAEAKESSLQRDLISTRDTVAQLEQQLAEKDQSYQQQLAVLNTTQTGLQQQIQERELTIASLESEITTIEENSRNQLNAENSTNNETITQLREELETAKNQLIEFQSKQTANDEVTFENLARLESQLRQQSEIIEKQESRIGGLQTELVEVEATKSELSIEKISQTVPKGPTIEIIDPPVAVRDNGFTIPVSAGSQTVDVIGKVSSAQNVISFQVNGGPSAINEHGIFKHNAAIERSSTLALTAVDSAGERTALEVTLLPDTRADASNANRSISVDVSQLDFGRYHALIIGNSNYQYMPNIETSENDATSIARILESKFGFSTELLLDADRYDILAALNRKRDELTRADNLLIYFAGHGQMGNGQGHWLPVDGDPKDKTTWISNVSLTGLVDSMNAKHVMIVADSVFSGTLSRSSIPRLGTTMDANQRLRLFELASNSKVRTVLTSGATRPIAHDGSQTGESIFTSSMLEALAGSKSNVIMAHDLFIKIRQQLETVGLDSAALGTPLYAPIKYAGHENGEFMFIPQDTQSGALTIRSPIASPTTSH